MADNGSLAAARPFTLLLPHPNRHKPHRKKIEKGGFVFDGNGSEEAYLCDRGVDIVRPGMGMVW